MCAPQAQLPADFERRLQFPAHLLKPRTAANPLGGALSRLQLETVAYASARHATFLPGGERCGAPAATGLGLFAPAPRRHSPPAPSASAPAPPSLSLPPAHHHSRSGGFFLGDGVGLGKGRQLAGLIWHNLLQVCTLCTPCTPCTS